MSMQRRAAILAGAVLVVGALTAASAPLANATVVTRASVPCSGPGGGAAGLVAAFRRASSSDVSEIALAAGCVYTLTQVDNVDNEVGANGLPLVTSTVVVAGNGATITRSGAAGTPAFRIFEVTPGGNLTLEAVSVTGGLTGARCDENFGGGIFDLGTLTLRRAVVKGNSAVDTRAFDCPAGGGGIFIGSLDSATLDASQVTGNTAMSQSSLAWGGGIFNSGGSLSILAGSALTGNTVSAYLRASGGGIASIAEGGAVTIDGTTVDGNTVTSRTNGGEGGGLSLNSGPVPTAVTIDRSTVNGNTATGGGAALGGGIAVLGASVTLLQSTVDRNIASAPQNIFGGGISVFGGAAVLVDSQASGNQPTNCYPPGGVPGCTN